MEDAVVERRGWHTPFNRSRNSLLPFKLKSAAEELEEMDG